MSSLVISSSDVESVAACSDAHQRPTATTLTPALLALPYELRQNVLQQALYWEGTVEIQYPIWDDMNKFVQPIFQVCRSLREEALRAFYEVNDFLWIVEIDDNIRSNPATYPISATTFTDDVQKQSDVSSASVSRPSRSAQRLRQLPNYTSLTPALPWAYPGLMRHLRHLHINVYLPQPRRPPSPRHFKSSFSPSTSTDELEARLAQLVTALDQGSRLAMFHVLVTSKRRSKSEHLTQDEYRALEALAGMKVRGKVRVNFAYSFRNVALGVHSANLGRRMKA